MASSQALGWGSGWPNCQTSKIVTITVGRNRLRLAVRREVTTLVAGLVRDLENARNKGFRRDWSFGFACRNIAGTNRPSNHSWGLAVDLDAPENPHMSASAHRQPHPLRKTYPGGVVLRSTMPMNANAIAKHWGFEWGGMWSSRPDPMHFEIAITPQQAARLSAERSKPSPPPPPPPPPSPWEIDVKINPRAVLDTLDCTVPGCPGFWELFADGSVHTEGNHSGSHFFGSYGTLRQKVDPKLPDRAFATITRRRDGLQGYVLRAYDGWARGFGPDRRSQY